MLKKHDAFLQVTDLLSSILGKLNQLSKPRKKFLLMFFQVWFSVRGRFNFINIGRYCESSEQTFRNQFKTAFDWFSINLKLVNEIKTGPLIAVFDPSYISKSGKLTPNLGYFWSGVAQSALKGLEIGCLALVDLTAETAFHLSASQTPNPKMLKTQGKTLIDHYLESILAVGSELVKVVEYLVVDGYFAKKEFINSIRIKLGLHVITKLRRDANLRYLFSGTQKTCRGRKREFAGKVNLKKIDRRIFKNAGVIENKTEVWSALLHWAPLNQTVRIVYLFHKPTGNYEVLMSTDTNQEPLEILKFYRLRFQIEFLLRDAKQHSGLEHCQSRNEIALHNHFNASLTAVSLAKAVTIMEEIKPSQAVFSMGDLKTWFANRLLTLRIFSNLDLDLSLKKNKRILEDSLNFGRMAA